MKKSVISALFVSAAISAVPVAFAVPALGAGQSFTPSVTGTTLGVTPSASTFVSLTDFTFAFSSLSGLPTTLYVTSSLPASTAAVAGAAIGTSTSFTDTASDSSFGGLATRAYHFSSGVTLDTNSTYFALVNTGSNLFSVIPSGTYAGGQYYSIVGGNYNANPTTDTRFAATFSAVPEPSAAAVLAGAGALVLAAGRRRRNG